MFQIYSCEAYFHLGLKRGIVLPVRANLPDEHQPMRWIPVEHFPPIAVAPIFAALKPSASHTRFNHRVSRGRLADVMRLQGPPGTVFPGKDSEGV